eukprot:424992_1
MYEQSIDPSSLIVTPDNNRYASLIHGFNLRFFGQRDVLKKIYVCSNTKEVHSALQDILNNNLDKKIKRRVTIRGGGHCYEGFVTDGTDVIIDISSMKKAERTNKYIAIESGFTNWEGVKYLFKQDGLCLPGGSCYSVGFGGHIVGGGYGLLSRKYGLTIDYLAGIELIYSIDNKTAICRTFLENNDANDEVTKVVWAHKGCGGGNYGIITKYYF